VPGEEDIALSTFFFDVVGRCCAALYGLLVMVVAGAAVEKKNGRTVGGVVMRRQVTPAKPPLSFSTPTTFSCLSACVLCLPAVFRRCGKMDGSIGADGCSAPQNNNTKDEQSDLRQSMRHLVSF
jgi:hypothetical protein